MIHIDDRLDKLIYQLFESDPRGKELLDLLQKKYLLRRTWEMGADVNVAVFRAGQNDVIHYFTDTIKNTKVRSQLKTVKNEGEL